MQNSGYTFIAGLKNKNSATDLSQFQEVKKYIVNFTDLTRDALHLYNRAMTFEISTHDQVHEVEVLKIYRVNDCSSVQKPVQLMAALHHSHSLVTARQDGVLIGLGNMISDGHRVVYFPHLLVHPDVQNLGAGRLTMEAMLFKYKDFHQKNIGC